MKSEYSIITEQWCIVFLIKVHRPTEDKEDLVKYKIYTKSIRWIDRFSKYNMRIMLQVLNVKIVRQEIFSTMRAKHSLHKINNEHWMAKFCNIKKLHCESNNTHT